MAKAAPPYLSVIVVAHDRRQYVQEAIESALAQTLDPTEYEIIVVKFFDDLAIDAWLEARRPRVRSVTDPRLPRLGQKLARGVELARGEVICFLEDDDRYLPGKLADVARRFRDDPTLTYFRNANVCIDSEGRRLVGPYARVSTQDLVLGPGERGDLAIVDFIRHYGADLNSAINVRRSIVVPQLERLTDFSTSADWVFFVSALAAPGTLVAGAQPLTEYRLHESLSQSPTHEGRQRLGREIVRSSGPILDIARGTRAERIARFLRGRGSVNWYLIDPSATRPTLDDLRGAVWPAWLRREPTFLIPIGWCGLRALAPRAVSNAFWGYRQRDSARQRWSVDSASSGGSTEGPGGPRPRSP